jgi:hypothetical protein
MHPFVTPAPRTHEAHNNNEGDDHNPRPNCYDHQSPPWTQLEHHLQQYVIPNRIWGSHGGEYGAAAVW